VARWRDLGVYRAISLLPGPEAADAALDPRFEQLLAAGDSGVLEALETYLDLCGDGQAAAERLYLHRGTLYYRLKKAQRISGINLRDGRDRLAIHLAFKIARSSGRYPA
jgi:DNA-binding PucR family transcriptional regulator